MPDFLASGCSEEGLALPDIVPEGVAQGCRLRPMACSARSEGLAGSEMWAADSVCCPLRPVLDPCWALEPGALFGWPYAAGSF